MFSDTMFTDTERLIGDAVRNQIAMNVTNTVFDAKRMIGRRFSDPTIQNDMKYWSFKYVIMDMTSQLLKFNTKGRQRDLHQKRSHHGTDKDEGDSRVIYWKDSIQCSYYMSSIFK